MELQKKKNLKNFIGAYPCWYLVNCNLSDQAGPGIKEEVTSPSWENREKFAASREKCFLMEDTPQKHDYIISFFDWLIVLGFNDTSTLEGHFVSSPREREKRDKKRE